MPDVVAFSITDPQTNNVIGTGTLSISFYDSEYRVTSISGTINGQPIDNDITLFGGADNVVINRLIFARHSYQLYNYGVDRNGIGFTAGGVSYNLMATADTNDANNSPNETGDNLVSSTGVVQTVTFTTAEQVIDGGQCFVSSTNIATARGEVAVEQLLVGDLVITATGHVRPIRWIGQRTVDCGRHASPNEIGPVRIAAHAFGKNLPARDLYLSPGHPVLVGADADNEGGHLVPIMCLINGTTIERVKVDEVTYCHVELDEHDILLAEGLPAESYLDWGDRAFFDEAAEHALANPDFVVPGLAGRCRPVALDGPVVEAERHRLERVFAMRLETACAWPGDDCVLGF